MKPLRRMKNTGIPYQLSWWERLWWRFVPGTVISVRWPRGPLVVDHNHPSWLDLGGAVWVGIDSADPNDHYRPELTRLCGRQGWDWNWGMVDQDATQDRLTIKIRWPHSRWAAYFSLKWA